MPKLILVGGNEFQKPDGIDEYIANESNGVIDLLPYAKEDAGAAATYNANQRYEPMGVAIRTMGSNELINPPTTPARVACLTGGDSIRLRDSLLGSALWQSLQTHFLQNEVILVGSSAGAMVLFNELLDEHGIWEEGRWKEGQFKTVPGLSLIARKILVIPHWNKSDDSWKTSLIDTYDKHQIIGVDENTAIVWEYGEAQVIGLGKVITYDDMVRSEYVTGQNFKLDLQFNSAA